MQDPTTLAPPAEPTPARERVASVDILRGLVMVLMVLDHTRDFFGQVNRDSLNLMDTTYALFFTRWVTHFCAPVFVMLAGTGTYFFGSRIPTRSLAGSLLRRGFWLVILEFTVVRFGISFDPTFAFFPLTVLWAIGVSMIVLSGLVFLPIPVIAAFGLALIAGHNAFDNYAPEPGTAWSIVWQMLHKPGILGQVAGRTIYGLYPLIPWVGVMAVGHALGPVFRLEKKRRRRILMLLGLACVACLALLRWSNLYGDPRPWHERISLGWTFLSFINVQKYPPSLLYLLITLGLSFVFLSVCDQGAGRVGRWLTTLGREPLFYYLAQWYLIHVLAIVVGLVAGRRVAWLVLGGPFSAPADHGYSLGFVYVMWIVCVAILWFMTDRFARWKSRGLAARTG